MMDEEDKGDCDNKTIGKGEKDKFVEKWDVTEKFDDEQTEISDEEKKQIEAHKLASMCYCEKLNSRDEEDDKENPNKVEKVKFANTVVVCPTYTSQVLC